MDDVDVAILMSATEEQLAYAQAAADDALAAFREGQLAEAQAWSTVCRWNLDRASQGIDKLPGGGDLDATPDNVPYAGED